MHVGDAPFPVTSKTDEIATFLKGDKPKVVFSTYQSSDLIAQVQQDNSIPEFDLIVADEAHRCTGKAAATFSTVLDGNGCTLRGGGHHWRCTRKTDACGVFGYPVVRAVLCSR